MRVYLDICSIKRPYDDQAQTRIMLETAAVLVVLQAAEEGRVTLLRSIAHDIENSQNPDHRRATAVRGWLESIGPTAKTTPSVAVRTKMLMKEGIRGFDAFHLAWAEDLNADTFVTTDDQLLKKGRKLSDKIRVRIADPITLAAELKK